MFIAHLPAGYLLSRLHPALKRDSVWVMAGAVSPDLDMLYFTLVDAGATHHHHYLTHRPALWLALCALSLLVRHAALARPLCALSLGALLHVALDSVAGAIDWGWPIWTWGGPLVIVPATYDWWVMSFLTHWTFAVELLICLSAAVWFWQDRMRGARTLPTDT
jgi:inner membrane protein